MSERCIHLNDRNWLPCVYCHPIEFRSSIGKELTEEEIEIQSKAKRGSTLSSINNPRALKLEGQTLAGCLALRAAASATNATRFLFRMSCGHEEIKDGSDMKVAEKEGRKAVCKACSNAARRKSSHVTANKKDDA